MRLSDGSMDRAQVCPRGRSRRGGEMGDVSKGGSKGGSKAWSKGSSKNGSKGEQGCEQEREQWQE